MTDTYLRCPRCDAKQLQVTEFVKAGPKDKVAIRCAYCGCSLAEAALTAIADDVTLPSAQS